MTQIHCLDSDIYLGPDTHILHKMGFIKFKEFNHKDLLYILKTTHQQIDDPELRTSITIRGEQDSKHYHLEELTRNIWTQSQERVGRIIKDNKIIFEAKHQQQAPKQLTVNVDTPQYQARIEQHLERLKGYLLE